MVRTRNGRIISHAEYFANCRLPNGWLFKEFGTKTPPLGTGFLLTRCAARPLAPERQLAEELAPAGPCCRTRGADGEDGLQGGDVGLLPSCGPSVSESIRGVVSLVSSGRRLLPRHLHQPPPPRPAQAASSLSRTGPWAAARTAHGTRWRALSAWWSGLPHDGTSSLTGVRSAPGWTPGLGMEMALSWC